jgi:hypothetical protein
LRRCGKRRGHQRQQATETCTDQEQRPLRMGAPPGDLTGVILDVRGDEPAACGQQIRRKYSAAARGEHTLPDRPFPATATGAVDKDHLWRASAVHCAELLPNRDRWSQEVQARAPRRTRTCLVNERETDFDLVAQSRAAFR